MQDAFTIDEDGERVERYVTDGEMLRGRKYDCQVVVTNVGGGSLRLSVLLQVPEGAVPLDGGKELKSGASARCPCRGPHPSRPGRLARHAVDVTVGAYETKRVRYSFYFPRVGHFRHYPAIVTDRHYRLMARAPSATLNVVSAFSTVDSRSWPRVVSVRTLPPLSPRRAVRRVLMRAGAVAGWQQRRGAGVSALAVAARRVAGAAGRPRAPQPRALPARDGRTAPATVL